tara:strand:- start:66 stop:308 length:243 start_codon:yes stop_codon:yes gene_type:complete
MIGGGNDEDEERIKRNDILAVISALRMALDSIAWCIVGTAVYQLGAASSNQLNTLKALKEGQQNTEPPAATDDNTAAINP